MKYNRGDPILVDIVVILILIFSFIGGLTQGAVKSSFSLISFIIAIPFSGRFYPFFANLLSFLPGQDWENFIGFFIALAIASVILALIFYLPRKIFYKIWPEGILSRFMGGILNLLGAAIGLVMFTLLISTYPVWIWLQQAIVNAGVIQWLVSNLGFVQGLLPEIMRRTL